MCHTTPSCYVAHHRLRQVRGLLLHLIPKTNRNSFILLISLSPAGHDLVTTHELGASSTETERSPDGRRTWDNLMQTEHRVWFRDGGSRVEEYSEIGLGGMRTKSTQETDLFGVDIVRTIWISEFESVLCRVALAARPLFLPDCFLYQHVASG